MAGARRQLEREWRQFRDDEPGVRFQNAWQRRRQRPAWFRALPIALGVPLLAAGGVMLFVPGPGLAAIGLGLALLGSAWRPSARALDRAEPAMRRGARHARRRWRRYGRAWYAATALVVLATLVTISIMVAGADHPRIDAPWARVLDLFTYFTIQSNVLVGAAALAVAIDRGRGAAWSRVLWAAALVAISLTAIVFHAVIAPLLDRSGPSGPPGPWAVVNHLLHTAIPVLFLAGWVLFGPRGAVRARTVLVSLVFPLAWLGLTFLRARIDGHYPYPFLDVAEIGSAETARNVALISALYLLLAAVLGIVDAALGRAARFMDRRARG